MVLSILDLHNIVNNIFHQIRLMPYSLSYKFDSFLRIPWAVNMLGLEYTRVVNMLRFCVNCILKVPSVLNVLSSEYAKVLNVSGV